MKKGLLLLIGLLFVLQYSFAQKKVAGTVKGTLADTAYNETLAAATVSIFHVNDSLLISHGVANEKGEFQIENLKAGSYRLVVSYQGYQPLTKKFTISAAEPKVNMGTINMEKTNTMLSEVVVKRPPMTVKGDTVEFSAGSFKTKPNAVAEDLLKKLPGVDVDREGNVTAQGQAIQKIYVNGKEFFANDPKAATKNISADMIESVQVYDDMSDQSKFNHIEDGSRFKAINIKLKRNLNQGYFGRGTVGYGTDNHYTASLMGNYFQGNQRITLMGSSNNLNMQGFGFGTRSMMGPIGGMMGGGGGGGGTGITKSNSIGINYVNNIGSKLQLVGSYSYGDSKNHQEQSSLRKTLFPNDSTTFEDNATNSDNRNRNHNFNVYAIYNIDSLNSLMYTPTISIQQSDNFSTDTNSVQVSKPGIDYLALNGSNYNSGENNAVNIGNQLLYRRKFAKFGRTFTLGYRNSINNGKDNGNTHSHLSFYNTVGNIDTTIDQDFITTQDTKSTNNVISSSYTEPVGKDKVLELNYAYTNKMSTSDRKAFSYRSLTQKYDSVNAQQTNYFKNLFFAHRAGLNFRFQNKIYNFQLGGAVQTAQQDNKSIQGIYRVNGKDSVIQTKEKYTDFFPTANFNYNFSRRSNIRVNYQGRTSQPTVKQLQDVRDETDVLRTVIGDPGLKQEFNNNVSINYTSFNMKNFSYINANLEYVQTSNKIVNSIDLDTARGAGVQLIKPVNLNGAFTASYNFTLGLPLSKMSSNGGISLNLTNMLQYNRDVSRLYGQNNVTNNLSLSQTAGVNWNRGDIWNIMFKGTFSYNKVSYTGQQNQFQNSGTKYFSQNYSTDIYCKLIKDLGLTTNFDYSITTGLAAGYNQSIPLWNASLAYQVFKKKNGEIKLSVNDILNENKSINRSIAENYTLDTRTIVLKRYFMLTFTYNLSRLGGGATGAGNHMIMGL